MENINDPTLSLGPLRGFVSGAFLCHDRGLDRSCDMITALICIAAVMVALAGLIAILTYINMLAITYKEESGE